MADISKINVRGTQYNVRDDRIITLEDNGTTTAGTWKAKTSKISSLVDGQLFLYRITVAGGSSTTTLAITTNGVAQTAKNVYRQGTSALTTHFIVGQTILLEYNSTNTCFRVVNFYDSDSDLKVRMISNTTSKAYVLGTTTAPTSSNQNVTSIGDSGVYLTTTAGGLHADTFETKSLKACTSASSTELSLGTSGQMLRSNGTTAFWADSNDIEIIDLRDLS